MSMFETDRSISGTRTFRQRLLAMFAWSLMLAGVLAIAGCGERRTQDERPKDGGTIAPAPSLAPPPPSYPATAPRSSPDQPLPPMTEEERDRFSKTPANPIKIVKEEPVSTFSADVDTASYSFVRRYLNEGSLPPRDAIRIEEMLNYFDYEYALPQTREQPFQPTVVMYPSPWNPDTYLLHIGIKGFDLPKTERPAANLVFLLDVSGSMNEPTKLPLVKNAMRLLVGELTARDRVAMVVYAGAAGTVLEPTPGDQKAKILAAFDRLEAGGSTAGAEGIRQAYQLAEGQMIQGGVNRVILATDGDFNVGITEPDQLKDFVARKRETGVTLSVLGFGRGNYNDDLMQKLAQNGNGNAAYIDTLNEARKVLVEEMGSTLFTIAKDVKFQVEFNPARVLEYRLIGYETRMLRREDFNNDQVDAGDIGAGHKVTALYEAVPVGAKSRLNDPLRYGNDTGQVAPDARGGEIAFLKMRYKLPDQSESRLIERPVVDGDVIASLNAAPQDMRFAAAVAGFGQVLRGDPYLKNFGLRDVSELAQKSKGTDPFGYRSEFIQLVRLAMNMPGLPTLQQQGQVTPQ